MAAPRDTAGTQVTGQERDDLPDQTPAAVPEASRAGGQAARPSEVEHAHAEDAGHLRPAAQPRRAPADPHETSGSPNANRP